MKEIRKNIKITKSNQEEINKLFEDCEILSGSVEVHENATFTAPVLAEVSGYVEVHENATFTAPVLAEVSGSVYVHENATFTAPVLAEVSGSVYVHENATFTAPVLAEVSGSVEVHENATFTAPVLAEVSGYVYVHENATFTAPVLAEVSGYVYVHENATFTAPVLAEIKESIRIDNNLGKEKQFWKKFPKNKWIITEFSSEWLIDKNGNFKYYLNNVEFERKWFLKIRFDKLKASQIFAIDNIEHRRIAYFFMDKSKMKELKDFTILDQVSNDGHGYAMQIIEFSVKNLQLKFLNCFCPSTGREYYIGTNKNTCWEAKNNSFGLEDVEWVEW